MVRPPIIFVTYSRDSEEHIEFVNSFTELLNENGFNARNDISLVKEETAISFPQMMYKNIIHSDKVIVVLSAGYKEKADNFTGGVSFEFELIIKDIDDNPLKYVLVCRDERTVDITPLFFKDRDILSLREEQLSNYKNLFEKLRVGDQIIREIPQQIIGREGKEFLDKVQFYSVRIGQFVNTEVKKLPFFPGFDSTIIKDKLLGGFLTSKTWREELISLVREFNREYNSIPGHNELCRRLMIVLDAEFNYREIDFSLNREINQFLLSHDRISEHYERSINGLYKLLADSYNKVFIISGESGTGKTHIAFSVLYDNRINVNLKEISIRIPVKVDDFRECDIENALLKSINYFMNTNYRSLKEINNIITGLIDYSIRFLFVIDDFNQCCNLRKEFFRDFKNFVEDFTKYDWISWLLFINEYEEYCIIDDSDFIERYYIDHSYDDESSNTGDNVVVYPFLNMSELNKKYNTLTKILEFYKFQSSVNEDFFPEINTIFELFINPLIVHVYASTVSDSEKELLNLCYFDFINRYTKIKMKKMLDISYRDISNRDELEIEVLNDMNKVINYAVEKSTLSFNVKSLSFLGSNASYALYELINTQLAVKQKVTQNYLNEEILIQMNIQLLFKMFWAYRIFIRYIGSNEWERFRMISRSFDELGPELLIYEILYLENEKQEDDLSQLIGSELIEKERLETLLFTSIKLKTKYQQIIFEYLFKENIVIKGKRELFSLLYFLKYTNANIPQKCSVIAKYINEISDHGLGLYLKVIMRTNMNKLSSLQKLKRCIYEFIACSNDKMNKIIAEISADNFQRILLYNEYSLERSVELIIDLLDKKTIEIELSTYIAPTDDDSYVVTFTELFLRYLFSHLIYKKGNEKMELHNILLRNDYYYFKNNKVISHIIRTGAAVAYGYVYKSLKGSQKDFFKANYIEAISKLSGSNNIRLKKLAFHFISNTLYDQDNPEEYLEWEFIEPLIDVVRDSRLKEFCLNRKTFINNNFKHHSLEVMI
ncbi:TIR domain-containing protein [Paenibacillus filicis]|uniref:TIR domain-containing protein n=1 Tax=Paenibacillus gyeongsangnamensis TaxID=3388067 RepID=A0ABT4QBZ3_9BACL|nr:SEFIR domain-containing protein [Paenibacillus filicis]MCZ8514340.1 TIR domain-containing protein [Paenibacillus filicis]